MTAEIQLGDNIIGLGAGALHALRRSLVRDLPDQAALCLQEAGYAAGRQIYGAFRRWLPTYARVDHPADLDASTLEEVVSAFFEALGWGRLQIERQGDATLSITSTDWAEAEPGIGAEIPSCYVASGFFADFMGRLSGTPVAVMEVECRSSGSTHCRFLVGTAQTMEAVYEAMAAGEG